MTMTMTIMKMNNPIKMNNPMKMNNKFKFFNKINKINNNDFIFYFLLYI